DVARGHCNRLEPARPARVSDVDRVLEKDDRVVVSEGDARAAERLCRRSDQLGRRRVGERVELARLRDLPVLAEAAGEVAAGRSERQRGCARQKVVQRLLLDRIDAETARPPVRREHDLIALTRADEAEPALALAELARSRADVALEPSVVAPVPVLRGDRRIQTAPLLGAIKAGNA